MSETAALNDDFAYAVLSAVAEIPEGCVATYGQLARLIGYPKNAFSRMRNITATIPATVW